MGKENKLIQQTEDVKKISAITFAELNGFSERNKVVIRRMFKSNDLRTIEQWKNEFKNKF